MSVEMLYKAAPYVCIHSNKDAVLNLHLYVFRKKLIDDLGVHYQRSLSLMHLCISTLQIYMSVL